MAVIRITPTAFGFRPTPQESDPPRLKGLPFISGMTNIAPCSRPPGDSVSSTSAGRHCPAHAVRRAWRQQFETSRRRRIQRRFHICVRGSTPAHPVEILPMAAICSYKAGRLRVSRPTPTPDR